MDLGNSVSLPFAMWLSKCLFSSMPYTLLTAVPFPHLSEDMAYLTIQVYVRT